MSTHSSDQAFVSGAQSMLNSPKKLALVCALSAGVVACGGGGPVRGKSTVAKNSQGEVVRSSSGSAVTKAAENRWYKAIDRFQSAEGEGWDADKCSSVSKAFQKANDAQGGTFAEAVFMSGLSLDRCGKREEALKRYNRTLKMDPKFCKARVGLGLDEIAKGKEQQAYVTFQRAIKDDAACTEGYTNLAILQMKRGGAEADEALNNLRRALAIDAQYLPAFNQMALLFLSKAQTNEKMLDLAAVVCRQAQLINANYAPIYNTWGLIAVRKENIFDALRMFEKSFQLDSKIFEAHMNFGQITLSFRGYQDAKAAFAKAVALRGKSYDAHVGLGAALRGLGDAPGAKAEYEKASSLDGKRPEAYFNLGLLYQDYMSGSVGDMKTAVKFFDKFVSRARGREDFSGVVENIERRCNYDDGGKKKRKRRKRSSKACRPGRRQNIEMAIEAMAAMAEMNAGQ